MNYELFRTFAAKTSKTMEKQQEETLMKVRSNRSILAASFRLYTKCFWPMLKVVWPWILIAALVTAGVAMMIDYINYVFVPLVIVAVLLELALWLRTSCWLTQRPLRTVLRAAGKHWLLLIGMVLLSILLTLPVCAIVSLPAIILMLAEWESQYGISMGDSVSLPTYFIYIAAATWFITALLHLCIRLVTVFFGYYAWGSAETKRREREQQKLNMLQ